MILFENDWNKYPTAIVDTFDKNDSFVRYALLLKEMGVKNHLFPLALINPDLKGLDPYDPHLSLEQIAAFMVEFKMNPWAFFRKAARVPGGTDDDPIPFRANRGNIALYWLFFNHITTLLIQIRQTGKSLSTDLLMTYLMNVRCINTSINLLTKDDTLRSANLERMKNIELELPFFLRQRGKGDIGNTEELTVKALGNRYRGHLPNKSPKMALNVGRGLTSPIFQIDEAAFFFNIAISMPAALAAGTAARDLAKKRGDPYGIILTTTAGKKDDVDGKYIYDFMMASAEWSEKFLDCSGPEELEHVVRRNSSKGQLRVNCTFNHRQLGYNDAWLKDALETTGAVGEDADRDFLNIWTSGSQLSPLPSVETDKIRKSQLDTLHQEISRPHGYVLRWYYPEHVFKTRMADEPHVMSIDSSDAAGGDDIGMTFRAVTSGEIAAAANINETNLITFAEWVCQLLIDYPKLTLIIERRSTGAMILDYLLMMLPARGIDPFTRIYNRAVQDAEDDPVRFKEITAPMYMRSPDIYIKHKKCFGFATSGSGTTSRNDLYSTTLLSAAKNTGHLVRDKKVVDQILGLVVKNGRVDHAAGEHDDMCISWLLSYWLLTLGKNLHVYGLDSREVLKFSKQRIEENNPVTRYDNRQQDLLRQQIEDLVNMMRRERDTYLNRLMESKLKGLASRLSEADRITLSVDDLIKKIQEEKSSNINRWRQ